MDLGNFASLTFFLPELLLAFGVLLLIVLDLLMNDKSILGYLALVLSALSLLLIAMEPTQAVNGAWMFHRMLVSDAFAIFFRALIALAAVIAVWMSIGSRNRRAATRVSITRSCSRARSRCS